MPQRNPLPSSHPSEKAGRAHADLILFAVIEQICESGNFSPASHDGAARIIKICQAEMQKSLVRGDNQRRLLAVPKRRIQKAAPRIGESGS